MHFTKEYVCMKEPLETVKGAICKNWSPVEFLLQTPRGQHTTEKPLTAANCSCHNEISSVSRAASTPDVSVVVYIANTSVADGRLAG